PVCARCATGGGKSAAQPRAVKPVYVGWVHDLPESKEKYTPETPTPGVKGHGLEGNWLLHACSSISSFEPATTMLLWLTSTATVGSFCLFCENGDVGLVLVTFTEPSAAACAASGPLTIPRAAADPSTSSIFTGFLMTLSLPPPSAPPRQGWSGSRVIERCSRSASGVAGTWAIRVKARRPGSRYTHRAGCTAA